MNTKIAFTFLTAAAIVCGLCSPLYASSAVDPTGQLAAIYLKTDSAADHKDVDGCSAFYSPSFLALDSTGKIETADQHRAGLAKLFDSVGDLNVTTHINHCDFADKTATVVITQHVKTMMPDPESGRQIPVSGDVVARELWTNGAAGWQIDVVQILQAGQLTPSE